MPDLAFRHRHLVAPPGAALTIGLALLGTLLLSTPRADAAFLKSAEVTAVVNDVKLIEGPNGERAAGVRDVVKGNSTVKTGIKSRAELLFQDKTLTRLGANTLFSFEEGTRDLELEHGTMLLQAPKGIGGARIRTAAVTAAITGTTILLEYSPVAWTPRQPPGVSPLVAAMAPEQCVLELQHPSRQYSAADLAELQRKAKLAKKGGGFVKVMVLEGTLRMFLNNRVGESVLVGAGQMIILNPNALTIPPKVDFDIARLAQTSLLVNNKFWGGGAADLNMALVSREISTQEQSKQTGDLTPTGLRILGGGTNIILGDDLNSELNRRQTAQQGQASSPAPTQPPNTSDGGTGDAGSRPDVAVQEPIIVDPLGFKVEGSSTPTTDDPPPTSPTLTGNVVAKTKLDGAVPVLPTEGGTFTVISTGGPISSAEGADPRSASKASRIFDLKPVAANEKRFLSFDYRFLSDEVDQGGAFADRFVVEVKNGTKSITYSLDRDALSPGGTGTLTPLAQAGVGGFAGGTDWLPFKIDVTPFANSQTTVSFLVYDRGDPVVDSAAAIDDVKVSSNPANPTAAALPGTLTLNLDVVTLGSAAGEFTIPNLESQPARDDAGPAADAGTFAVNTTGAITLNGPINASTGANGDGTNFGGKGGTVQFNSTGGEITVNSTIKVSESSTAGTRSKASASGGSIALTSGKTTGAAITINNTGELLALLNATAPGTGGKIQLTSSGGLIHVNGGKLTADRGTIEVVNNGAAGPIQLTNAQLAADVIKVGALGNNGVLTVGGGTMSADTTLKLYAGGSNGEVKFVDNVTLSGASTKTIAGNTVTINDTKVVTVSGPAATVFTNNANYTGSGGNGTKSGTFAGTGASTLPFNHASKPAF
jgi:hypothetical protein